MGYEQQFLTELENMARTQAALSQQVAELSSHQENTTQQLVGMQQTLKEVLKELALAKAAPAAPPRSRYHPDNIARREFEKAQDPVLTVEQNWAISSKKIARREALKQQQVVEAEPLPAVQAPVPEAPVDLVVDSDFGLLAAVSSTVDVKPGAGFFALDDDMPQVPVLETMTKENQSLTMSTITTKLRCAKLQKGLEPLERRTGVPEEVYGDGVLEHPAVPSLQLTKDERLYSALLEIIDENGKLRLETLDEKRYRIKWKQPIPVGATSSREKFTEMDLSLFRKRPAS